MSRHLNLQSDFEHGFADGGFAADQRRMAVGREKQGELADMDVKPGFAGTVKKFDVTRFVVACAVFQTASVRPAVGFRAAEWHLDVDVAQVRFGLCRLARSHGFAADKQADVGIAGVVLSVGQRGEIEGLQQADGVGKVGMQRGIAGGVGDGVGNHVLCRRFQTACLVTVSAFSPKTNRRGGFGGRRRGQTAAARSGGGIV